MISGIIGEGGVDMAAHEVEPDQTAVRVALWRAMHVLVDQPGPQAWKRRRLTEPAVVASTGVSMYLTREANEATLRQLASLAPGSTAVVSFLLPVELLDERDRPGLEISARGARASGTPFISFFTPGDMLALARQAGFAAARHVSGAMLDERYFAGRADGLRVSGGEDLLVAPA